jgi:ATP-dependent DNA helicase RecG
VDPLTRDDFAALVASREDSFTEFKDPRVSNADVAKEMCCFANAHGGRILIGVDDDGRILDAGGWTEEDVMNIARTSIDPPLTPSYQRLRYDQDREVVIVGVDQGVEKPYAYLRDRESRRYLVRFGSTCREANKAELVRLAQASGAVPEDLRPALGSSIADLDTRLLEARFAGLRSLDYAALPPDEQRRVLTAAEILHESGPATIGGLLCYGSNPQVRLPFATVSCAAYPRAAIDRELVDRAEIGGRVDSQIARAVEFIERNVRRSSLVEGVYREEAARPSTESFREVVANAVAHRHYGIAGPIQLRVFADRVEAVSPGGLPNGVTPEAMRLGVSIRRNEFIVQHLVRARIVDALGRGVLLLYEEAAALGLREPEIDPAGTATRVTLFLGNAGG